MSQLKDQARRDLLADPARKEALAAARQVVETLAQSAPETKENVVARLGAKVGTEIDTSPAPDLLLGHLEPRPNDHTILYGPASVGKGVIAAECTARLIEKKGMRVLVADFEGHSPAWARKVQAFGGDLARLMVVEPYGSEWHGAAGPIWKKAEDLATLASAFGADFLFIDSVTAACAMDVSTGNTEAPNRYGEALQRIGVPAASLAHVGRSADLRYPFGSIFWHAWARTTWSVVEAGYAARRGTEDDDMSCDGDRIIQNRKSNDRPLVASQSIAWSWVHMGLPQRLSWSEYKVPTIERIVAALAAAEGALGPSDLSRILSEDGDGSISSQACGKVSRGHPEALLVGDDGKV